MYILPSRARPIAVWQCAASAKQKSQRNKGKKNTEQKGIVEIVHEFKPIIGWDMFLKRQPHVNEEQKKASHKTKQRTTTTEMRNGWDRRERKKRDRLNYLVMILILCRGKKTTTTPLLSATKIYEVPGFVVDQSDVRNEWMSARTQPIRYLTFLLIQTCFWHWYPGTKVSHAFVWQPFINIPFNANQ